MFIYGIYINHPLIVVVFGLTFIQIKLMYNWTFNNEKKMKIITPFGFGKTVGLAGVSLADQESITVNLDKPFLGKTKTTLEKGQVFLFSDWAVIRVLNISGHGWFSNLQFYGSKASAEATLAIPTPPDETTFFLNLRSGKFKVNRRLGIMAENSLIMKPWIDRWAEERTATFDSVSKARKAFREEIKRSAGTGGGIAASVHVDSAGGENIIGFYLLVPPPQGVIRIEEFNPS